MTATTTTISTGTYRIDPVHSSIGFVARHAMVTKVRATFNEVEGWGVFDVDSPEQSSMTVSVVAASIDSRNSDRDTHLRSADFFDVENHPTITFSSTKVSARGDRYEVVGDLTIKGVTRPVTFNLEVTGPAVDHRGNTRIGVEGSAVVNRKDWGLTWNAVLEAGGVLVSEKVTLELEVSAVMDPA